MKVLMFRKRLWLDKQMKRFFYHISKFSSLWAPQDGKETGRFYKV